MKPLFLRLALASACALSMSCPKNPATGARQLNLISRDQEIQLGQQGAQEVTSAMGLVENEALNRYVEEVGMKLAKASERPNLPWSFRVVDDNAVNAFALPGGPIFVTRGLLAHMNNEAQLAIVLGHEVGHVTAEHSVNQLSKAQVAQVGLGIGSIFAPQLAGLGGAGMQLLFLKFGRDDERQSDKLGLRYASKVGYDLRVAPEVFEVLRRVSEEGGGGKLPGWLMTHPDPAERAKNMRERLAKMAPGQLGQVREEERYMRSIEGMTYGEDPREGFVRGNRFYHPGMRFQMEFPPGFKIMNTKTQVAAQPESGDAALVFSLGPQGAPQAALDQFFAKSGAEARGPATPIGQAIGAPFRGQTEDGVVAGWIAFLQRGDTTFEFMLLAPEASAAAHEGGFRQLVTSFAPLEDPAMLNMKPARIKVDRVGGAVTIQDLHRAHPAVSAEELARLNQVPANGVVPAGSFVKWVEGG